MTRMLPLPIHAIPSPVEQALACSFELLPCYKYAASSGLWGQPIMAAAAFQAAFSSDSTFEPEASAGSKAGGSHDWLTPLCNTAVLGWKRFYSDGTATLPAG